MFFREIKGGSYFHLHPWPNTPKFWISKEEWSNISALGVFWLAFELNNCVVGFVCSFVCLIQMWISQGTGWETDCHAWVGIRHLFHLSKSPQTSEVTYSFPKLKGDGVTTHMQILFTLTFCHDVLGVGRCHFSRHESHLDESYKSYSKYQLFVIS